MKKAGLFTRLPLRLQIARERHGWGPALVLAVLTLAAALYSMWLMPLQEARRSASLWQERAPAATVPKTGGAAEGGTAAAAARLYSFPADRSVNDLVARVFVAAEHEGLQLEQSSYHYEQVTGFPWVRVTISIPVTGAYPLVRRFVETVLREHPNVALDQLSFKREASAQATPEVLLSFSAWFSAEAPAGPPGGAHE